MAHEQNSTSLMYSWNHMYQIYKFETFFAISSHGKDKLGIDKKNAMRIFVHKDTNVMYLNP